MRPTSEQIRRAAQVQNTLLNSGDNDLWQQACRTEQDAALEWTNGRLIAGNAPLATAFGMIVQAGLLLHALGRPELRDAMVERAQDYLMRAIEQGPPRADAPDIEEH